jgi:lipopolysaccharide transport system ATP-binding protein
MEYMGDVDKAIILYFGEKNFDSLQKSWPTEERPGNDYIKVNRIRLVNSDGSPLRSVTLSRPFQIEVEFETLSSDVNTLFSFSLHSSGSELIFGSVSNSLDKSDSLIRQPGIYKITCEIPGNFLNNGSFYINVNGYTENFTNHFAIENPLGFEAYDDGILRKEYKGNYSGYIRPLLNWKISTTKNTAPKS